MDFIKMFTGSNNSGDCDHTKSKLHRRVPSKPEYKIRMPGIGTAISISGKMPDFIYHCPNCLDFALNQPRTIFRLPYGASRRA